MAQLDILQIFQSIPQQFIPYILLFGVIFFLVSFTKISWKIRLAVALAASVGINFEMPTLLSPIVSLMNNIVWIGATLIMIALGFIFGRKRSLIKLQSPKQTNELIRNLEVQKSNLMLQLNSVRGDINREQQVMIRINEIDNRLRKERARLGLPV